MTRCRVANHSRRHNTDRAGSRDEDIFSEHRKRKRRMYRVTEWIENGSYLLIHMWIMPPDITHRKCNTLSKRSWPVDAYALCMCTQMPPPRETVAASAADYVSLAAHNVPRVKVVDV